VCRVHPACPDCHRPVVDSRDAELLEAFNPTDDIHQSIDSTYLVERHAVRRHSVDSTLRLAQELEGAHCTVPYPGRQLRGYNEFDELADVPVWTMLMRLVVIVKVL
jgi:hypothetical protein